MRIDTGGTPQALICPCCGRTLAPEDEAYFNERLQAVGCEFCLMKLPAAQLAERQEEVA